MKIAEGRRNFERRHTKGNQPGINEPTAQSHWRLLRTRPRRRKTTQHFLFDFSYFSDFFNDASERGLLCSSLNLFSNLTFKSSRFLPWSY